MCRGYSAVGLHNCKDNLNIGSALRAVGCYGASFLAVSGSRYERSRTDTGKIYKHTPMFHCDNLRHMIPFKCKTVAIDIVEGAVPLREYSHPERGFYIFGPEDGTLGIDIIRWCDDVVKVDTRFCMNLAATVNVVLYDRMSKYMLKHS